MASALALLDLVFAILVSYFFSTSKTLHVINISFSGWGGAVCNTRKLIML